MPGRLLSPREIFLWAGGFLLVALLLVFTRFTSDDPDSALYAALAERLAQGPVSHWIAPEWWGHWNTDGLFVECPAGTFLLPAALGAIGIPTVQAAYVVGIAAGLASLLLIGVIVSRVTSVADARLALVLLQWMPVAFIFRIRANHEYQMLACLLVVLLGLDGVRRSWRWTPVVAAAFVGAFLIKGAFVAVLFMAAAVWIATNPSRTAGSAVRPIVACLVSVAAMAAAVVLYDAAYFHATGLTFWGPYWHRQLAPVTISTPLEDGSTFASHLWFYALRLLWHPAPWSFAIVAAIWSSRRTLGASWRAIPDRARRGVLFAIGFAGLATLVLSPASRFAERYMFSANFAIGTLGAVVACHTWPRFRSAVEQVDARVPALPAMTWLMLMLLRLTVGPLLPRLSG